MGRVLSLLDLLGFDPRKTSAALRGLPRFFRDYQALRSQAGASDFPFAKWYPCLNEAAEDGGSARGHYFHQDIIIARRILQNKPERHVDIGSRVDGFVAHVAVFRPIEVFDIRPLTTSAKNILFRQLDITAELPSAFHAYSDSLSCLHALEHFGLGRYGDPIDSAGHEKALRNLAAILKPGGRLYVSVPIGPQRIEFNAHRVFGAGTIPQLLKEQFHLDRFSYVDDAGDVVEDVRVEAALGCNLGCGIYEFTKLS